MGGNKDKLQDIWSHRKIPNYQEGKREMSEDRKK